jgi:DNA-binding beta-propeller fold protein YncE
VLPELDALEKTFPNELVVIGIHSAKFPNEREAESIRQAILRHGLAHPVVNDDRFIVWRSYAVRAWPTLVLIDPEGYIVTAVAGEGHGDQLRPMIAGLIKTHRAKGTLREGPVPLLPEKMPETPLAFPGKVLIDPSTGRLFIADTGHHRIVIGEASGKILDVAGTGMGGAADGPFDHATLRSPQGLALTEHFLYVADTENHLIRRLDLEARLVTTIAGTGRQGEVIRGWGPAREMALNSPWDLCLVDGSLYIAMAGCHQIWVMELATKEITLFAGTGLENILDGPRLEGALAQPSGICTDGQVLYVADSEVSAIRAIDLRGGERLRTLVGQGLFVFGDRDGIGKEVRLQHPLGVSCAGGQIYVADSYNHKIKVLYPTMRAVKTLFGTGQPGQRDGRQAEFFEPGGLSATHDHIYIADTNNHRIRLADLTTGEVTTLQVSMAGPEGHVP